MKSPANKSILQKKNQNNKKERRYRFLPKIKNDFLRVLVKSEKYDDYITKIFREVIRQAIIDCVYKYTRTEDIIAKKEALEWFNSYKSETSLIRKDFIKTCDLAKYKPKQIFYCVSDYLRIAEKQLIEYQKKISQRVAEIDSEENII
jgi:hypothetical protein